MKSKDITQSEPNNQIAAIPSIGGVIVPDAPFTRDSALDTKTYMATYIRVGAVPPTVGGTLIVEDQDGIPMVFEGVVSGEWLLVGKSLRVLSGPVTTPKGTFTTDCEKMQWRGGSY